MKHIITLFLVLLLGCSPVLGDSITIPPQSGGGEVKELTEQQQNVLQMDANIFCQCVLETAAPFIVFGFSTETSLYFGMKECTQEAENLEVNMTSYGLTEEEQVQNFETLFDGMTVYVDNERNKRALELLKKFKEKKKGEVDL